MTKSILDIEVSGFSSYHDATPKTVNLLQWLQDDSKKKKVEEIRALTDKERVNKMKATLPAITVSGTFKMRKKEDLIAHSGLICIDIDEKDNQHLGNYHETKRILSTAPFVAYCGLSVSGTGYFAIVPLLYPDKHEQHFAALARLFKTMKINIDAACKDITRLRGYSWDSESYINHNATPFAYIVDDKEPDIPFEKSTGKNTTQEGKTKEKVEQCIMEIKAKCIDITDAYSKWLEVGFALATEFGEAGRQYFHQVSQYHCGYKSDEADTKYTDLLKTNKAKFNIGTFFHQCTAHGVTIGRKK